VLGAVVGALFGWRRRKATAALAPAKP
jgi:hypothetical protein